MQNSNDNILSRLLKSMHVMSQYVPRIRFNDLEDAKQQANNLPYLTPSSPIATFGSQSNPLGLAKNTSPLPDVSSSLRSAGRKPYVPSSVPSLPVATFGSQPNPLGIEPLPNAIETSDLASLKPKQSQLPEPISSVEPQKSVQPQQSTVPHQDTGSQQSFWDYLRSPEFLQRLSDYGIGYALSDGTIAQSLANAAMNLRRGDMEREKRGQVNQTVEYLKSKGYSEEEAAIMARNPQMLSAMLTGGDKPQLDKGYEWDPNSQLGERRARPVKGSMQELEYNQKLQAQKEWEHKKRKNMLLTKQQARIGINAIQDAIKIIKEGFATGFVGWGSRNVGGSPAYELEKLFDTIKGGALKAVFESLKSMDPKGNLSVGPISDQESRNMIATFGSLDAGRKEEGLLKTLGMLEKTLVALNKLDETQLYNWVTGQPINTPKEISDQYFADSPMSQGGSENIPIVKSTEEIAALPKGQKFFIIDANGKAVPFIK
ncbi:MULTISPECIES: hypothetical protein [unclassified Bartonella]|uniref:hypothetical protein n=1 Tax=unclassified Bartonella TaxID=2645622 RepID=UPI0035CF3187